MTKLTKLALEQKNAALASENAELRKQIEDYKLRLEMAQTRVPRPVIRELSAEAQAIVDARINPAAARLQAMQLAREMAMRSGCIVKV